MIKSSEADDASVSDAKSGTDKPCSNSNHGCLPSISH